MSLDPNWCLPGGVPCSVNQQSHSPRSVEDQHFRFGADSPEVRAIVDGVFSKLKYWLDERLHHQDKLLFHLVNAKAPLSTSKKKQLQRKKQAFVSVKADKADLVQSAPFLDIMPQGSPNPSLQKLQDKDAADKLEESSKTSSQQSYSDVEEINADDAAVGDSQAVLEVVEVETETPEVSPRSATGLGVQTRDTTTARQGSRRIDENLDEWRQKLLGLFDELDLDSSGTIDRSELRTAFIEVGIPPIDALQTFMIADVSNSDDIDRIEWLRIIEASSAGADAGSFVEFARKLVDAKLNGKYGSAASKKRRNWCIIRHDSTPRMCWDMLMVFFLAYVAVALPFSFGFGPPAIIVTIDNVCDAFFLIDICLNFRTTYIDSDENLVIQGRRIAKHYVKTWFTLDLVSSAPWDVITAGLLPGLQPARLLKIGKIAKVLKLLRIGKVIKLVAGSSLLERMEEALPPKAHQTVSKILYLVTITMMLCHWLACFMAATDGYCIDKYLGVDQEPSKDQRYLAALYWAMTTLTTVGYGDLIPTSDSERLYSMLAMIVGGSFYGYIIGCMTSVITDMDIDAREFNTRMEMLDAWLEYHEHIPQLLKRRIRRHFRRHLQERTSVDDAMIVKDLSPELRADAASFVIHVEVRRNVIFRDLPNSALGTLLDVLKLASAKVNENIVAQGDPGIAMYIIVDGIARFSHGHPWIPPGTAANTKNNVRLRNMKKLIEGDSFGEEIIFTLDESYRYTIVAESLVSMYSLSEDAFKLRFRNLPDLHELMMSAFVTSRQ